MKVIRGYLALFLVFVVIVLGDPVQRFLVAPLARLMPSRRIAILSWWMHRIAKLVVSPVVLVGGARFPTPPRLPGDEGTLIVMNHQSVFDIPLVVFAVADDAYPVFVTRKRYFKWIPTVSHLVRLYQYPGVDPRANSREMKKSLGEIKRAARETKVPLCIYPEGTRTRDGEVGDFRPKGLKLILKQRAWKVHVLVGDGYWEVAKLKDFMKGMSGIRGRMELAGVFEWTDPKADSEAFIEELRQAMVNKLAEMRAMAPA